MDTLDLETLLANLMALTIGCGVLYIYTARWRRERAMRKLAYELDCNYKQKDPSLLDQYAKFFTLQVGHGPKVNNLLTRQEGEGTICIFDLTYIAHERIQNMRKGHVRLKTVIVLSHPRMTMPHFYIRPETAIDKVRENFGGAFHAFQQFKEGINALTGQRLKELNDHVNRDPSIQQWLNSDEIELLHDRPFSDAHWIKGHDRDAIINFLRAPITRCIAAEEDLIWEGLQTTFLVSGTKNQISHKDIPHYVKVAREFMNQVLADSKPDQGSL
ncbi:MAG: hypothetical protein HOK97_12330 [Deltaproteobacteria bacterium]|jgi:hypothetical protein|nr:hypothetical protein [Deltaproteobacteria bacterium]MBT6490547.1 hypothetical protein [Deltaproteobacteria bacterium]